MMVGSDVAHVSAEGTSAKGAVKLEARHLSASARTPFAVSLKNICLKVHAGEVLAIAGVAGNGQGELFDALSGEYPAGSDDVVRIAERPVGTRGINARRLMGAGFVPEERHGHAAVSALSLSDNLVLARNQSDRRAFLGGGVLGLIRQDAVKRATKRISQAMDVRKSGENPPAGSLSGGNLQKFIVGRELDRQPTVLVVNQPTWGVDAGAASRIRQALVDLAKSGSAVLVISQDLDEIFEVATEIAVISEGRLSDIYPAAELSREKIGLLMGGMYGKTETCGDGACALSWKSGRTSPNCFRSCRLFIALVLTMIFGGVMFLLLGKNPVTALYSFFIEPLMEVWSLHELAIKAAPLILIGVGLSVCYRSNNWNIGAEGQFIMGAIAGSILPVVFHEWHSPLVLPLMLLLGMLGGALFAGIPAFLKAHLNTNEILTSLMLVYVAQLFLDWLVRGPWRNPGGMNFPETRTFDPAAILPEMIASGRTHWGFGFAILRGHPHLVHDALHAEGVRNHRARPI